MVAHMTGESATLALNRYTLEHIIHMLLTLSIGVICYFYIKHYLRTHHSLEIIKAENSPAKSMFTIKSALIGMLIATFSGFGVVGLQKSKQNFPSGAYLSSICITIIIYNFARKSIIRCFFMLQIRKLMLTKPLPFRECFRKGRVHPNSMELVNIPGPSTLQAIIPSFRRPILEVSDNKNEAERPPPAVLANMPQPKRPPTNIPGAERPTLAVLTAMLGAERPPLAVSANMPEPKRPPANMPGAERPTPAVLANMPKPKRTPTNMPEVERPTLAVSTDMPGAERPPLAVSDNKSRAERSPPDVSANMPAAERSPPEASANMPAAERSPSKVSAIYLQLTHLRQFQPICQLRDQQ